MYISYLSFLFLAAVFITTLIKDLRSGNFLRGKLTNRKSYKVSIAILVSLILFSPWLLSFRFHLTSFFRGPDLYKDILSAGPLIAGGYSLFTGLFGSSIYPWNKTFIILFTGLIISFYSALYFIRKMDKKVSNLKKKNITRFNIVTLFTIIFFLLLIILSLVTKSFKSQILLILHLLFSIILSAYAFNVIQKPGLQAKGKQTGNSYLLLSIVFFVCIWIAGSINIFNRQHFHKMGLSDPVGSVLKVVKENINNELMIVMTTNPVISFYLTKEMNDKIIVIAPKGYYQFAPSTAKEKIEKANIFFIESYLGSLIPVSDEYFGMVNRLKEDAIPLNEPVFLGKDEDYRMKKEITSARYLPEYRFVLHHYKPKTVWEIEKLFQLSKLSVY